MNKIFKIAVSALLLTSMVACTSTNTSTETYNGISKTVTETTSNGKTTTKTEYTDEDGNVLSEKEGKAAFEKAKAAIESAEEDE